MAGRVPFPATAARAGLRPAILAAAALAAACGEAPSGPVVARSFADPGVVTGGRYEMRYGIVTADEIPPAVAETYGIDRRRDRVVVNVSVLARQDGSLPAPVQAAVSGSWRGLVGEPERLDFRRVGDGGTLSYVAEAPVGDRAIVVFELAARPPQVAVPLTARITREFPADRR